MVEMTPDEIVKYGTQELLSRAARCERTGDLAGAERWYREWMRLLPNDPRPRYGLALVLLKAGKYEEGFALYEARTEFPETGVVKPEYVPNTP